MLETGWIKVAHLLQDLTSQLLKPVSGTPLELSVHLYHKSGILVSDIQMLTIFEIVCALKNEKCQDLIQLLLQMIIY